MKGCYRIEISYQMKSGNCIWPEGDCSLCSAYNEFIDECNQDEDLGRTGHGDESYSDADPGL